MTEYYKAFVAMCKRVSCMKLTEEEGELMSARMCKAKSSLHCQMQLTRNYPWHGDCEEPIWWITLVVAETENEQILNT